MHGWKKCPFCGGEVVVGSRKSFEERLKEHGAACLRAECGNLDCGCTLYVYSRDSSSGKYDDMLELLRAKWNRRAP